jgi:hypothetical protein
VGALAGINRRLFDRLRVQRLVLDGECAQGRHAHAATPLSQSHGSAVGVDRRDRGAIYFDDDSHALTFHNGSGWQNMAGAPYRGVVGTSAATLTAADSGSVIMFNNATGYAVTLPPAAVGLTFRVFVNVTVTSGVARLACATGDFFSGTLFQGTDTTYLPAARVANGTTHLAWEGDGSTTSGIAGDWFDIVATSSTVWQVIGGLCSATGTEATFWKTS